MAFYAFFLAGLLILIFISKIIKQWKLRAQLPPGPVPWPLLGNLPTLLWPSKRPVYEKFLELSKKYGEAMTLWYGTQPMVFLNSVDAIRSSIIDNPHDFASRPTDLFTELFTEDSVIFAKYTATWQKQKKLANQAMRSIVGSKQLENHVIQVCAFADHLYFSLPFNNQEFVDRLKQAKDLNKMFDAALLANALPARKWLPWEYVFSSLREITDIMAYFRETNRVYFDEHVQSLKADHVRDIMDALLLERKSAVQDEDQSIKFTDQHAAMVTMDIVLAGTETTRRTMSWFFLFMVVNPDIQEKLAQQIHSVLDGRTPSLADRPNLPLVEAALLETMRIRPIVPIGVPHAPTKDGALLLGKYRIPENTQVILHQNALHMDPKHWRNAEVFDPNHFLDDDGVVIKPPAFQPFGVGRRVCLGESLAKNDMFLIVANLLQKLRFKAIPGRKYSVEPSLAGHFNAVEEPYEVLVEIRD